MIHLRIVAVLGSFVAIAGAGCFPSGPVLKTSDAGVATLRSRALEQCVVKDSSCAYTTEERSFCDLLAVCAAGLVRPEIADAVFACFAAEPCDDLGSELCYVPERVGFEPSARWLIYEPACLARFTTCRSEGAPFINDFCQKPYGAATDAVLDQMQACLDGPCADVMPCVQNLTTERCASGPVLPTPDAGPLPENGAYQLEGMATLATSSTPQLKQEYLTLFVDATGTPTHVRDRFTEDTFALTFATGASVSDDACPFEGCDLRVERATRCAVYDYVDYFRTSILSDTGYAYTGRVRACPTAEVFVPVLEVRGALVADTLLPSGRLRVRANFPIDAATDTFMMTLDGAALAGSVVPDGDLDSFAIELGTVPLGASFTFVYTGPRPVSPVAPSTFATTAVLTDLTLATPPPAGSMDMRGTPLVYASGALTLNDEGRSPRRAFATLIALGDPGTATRLVIDAVHTSSREGAFTSVSLVRADGTGSTPVRLGGVELDVPPGDGDLWLLLTNDQVLYPPGDRYPTLVFTIRSLSWME